MSVPIVVNTAPHGSEGQDNAFRLAAARAPRDEHVGVFLMGDAPDVSCCGNCCTARGLAMDELVPGVRAQTIHDLVAVTARSDRVVSL